MDELEIQGKKYISSKRASELTGYAKDYIGQLARAGKISGTRMGRAWYVEEAALLAHKSEETGPYESQSVADDTPQNHVSQIPQKTPSPVTYFPKAPPQTWEPISYFSDSSELIPRPFRAQIDDTTNNHVITRPVTREDTAQAVELPLRIKVLEQRMMRTGQPAINENILHKARIVKHRRRATNRTLSLGALGAALAVFLFFGSGVFLSSDLQFTAQNGTNTASILVGYEYARDVLRQYPIFQDGLSALVGFFTVVVGSFGNFLARGIEFIASIPHLFLK